MPPTCRSNRVASSTAPGSQRNDRQQARAPRRRSPSTWGESSQSATIAEAITFVAPAVSLPTPTARQAALSEDLITTLVSSVTTAVAQQLSALLPSPSAAPSTNSQSSSTTYPVVQSVSSDHAATLVQDALGDVHSTLSGQPRKFSLTEQLPTQPFYSASLPLDARVPDKIKENIWKEKFVDFGVLLTNPDQTARYELNVQPSHIFVSIYTQRCSHQTPTLMKHCQIVQDLAARDHHSSHYDENFRFLHETRASQVPWATVHWELWLRSQNYLRRTSHVPSPQSSARLPQTLSVPRGFCYKFHRGAYCPGCEFKHVSFKCNGAHRSVNCNFRSAAKKSSHERSPRPVPSSVANTSNGV